MSSSLYWKPVKNPDTSLPSDLKFLLRELYGTPVYAVLKAEDCQVLKALGAGRSNEMKKALTALSDALDQHGEICVYEDNW